jgi:site-specific DNA-methyltransferase (adenine-specific)
MDLNRERSNMTQYIGCHDCMDLIKKIKDTGRKVDAIITDPPFNISVKNNFHTLKGRKGIDFGEWDKEFDLTSWIKTAVEILKDGGNIIIFNAWRNMGVISDELEKCGCLVKEMIQWQKQNPMPRNRDRLYVTTCEFAIWATKGKGWTFNRQRENYENTIFTYPIVNHTQRIHPTQKPVELMKDIIKIHTNENDIVFDPFGGGFSTAVACKLSNRQYISCDIDEKYVEFGKKRLEETFIKD